MGGGGADAAVTLEGGAAQHAKHINVREPDWAPGQMAAVHGAPVNL